MNLREHARERLHWHLLRSVSALGKVRRPVDTSSFGLKTGDIA